MAEEGDPNPLAVLSPPHWIINNDDHGGYVIIATWSVEHDELISESRPLRSFVEKGSNLVS